MARPTQRSDIYNRITDRIIADLEKGVRPWVKPWNAQHAGGRIARPLRHGGQPYTGVNVLMLWASALEHGFTAPFWMTYRQAFELGGHVRQGEKGSVVVYANSIKRAEDDEDGEEIEREIRYLKAYTVFNVEQIEGLSASYYAKAEPRFNSCPERIAHAEQFFAATKADIRQRGAQAFYAQVGDYIQMPPIEAFRDAESYYATLGHEAAHWTKHPLRLNRDFERKGWVDDAYAREELVAELAAAFLCADLELAAEVREDHAAYLDHWLKVLRQDKRAIFSAAAHAQRAVDYLHSLQPSREEAA